MADLQVQFHLHGGTIAFSSTKDFSHPEPDAMPLALVTASEKILQRRELIQDYVRLTSLIY
jgi:hypothetical protein